ncbi:MAG: GWxTD domain-containing protein [Ekhidna sp.]|nr:GWxTD domain-containing protein [Ekhidna sp.]
MKTQCLFLISLVWSGYLYAIDFSGVNVAWQYNLNVELRLAHRVFQNEEGIFVLLQVSADSLARWEYEFLIQDGYEAEHHEVIKPLSVDTINSGKNEFSVKLHLASATQDLLVVRVYQFEQDYYYDIALKIGNLSFPPIYPLDRNGLPIYKNYINRSGYSWNQMDSLHIIKYAEDFSRSAPPMADMKPLAPTARQDTAFQAKDSVFFEENFFYMVRDDINSSTGVTILRTSPYFPKYRKLTELVEAMLYLTSEVEEKALLKSRNLKKDFDSFWINNLNTKLRARDAIRQYYESVEQANILFTDYKPGWKTDRGMMYMIYGVPDEVYRLDGLEEWYYDSGEAFEFNVISSFFAPRTYSLRRSRNFEESWFRKVVKIRKGSSE